MVRLETWALKSRRGHGHEKSERTVKAKMLHSWAEQPWSKHAPDASLISRAVRMRAIKVDVKWTVLSSAMGIFILTKRCRQVYIGSRVRRDKAKSWTLLTECALCWLRGLWFDSESKIYRFVRIWQNWFSFIHTFMWILILNSSTPHDPPGHFVGKKKKKGWWEKIIPCRCCIGIISFSIWKIAEYAWHTMDSASAPAWMGGAYFFTISSRASILVFWNLTVCFERVQFIKQ